MKYILFILILGIVSCKDTLKNTSLKGTYVSEDNLLYRSFTFKGKSTVVLKDGIIGFEHVLSYEKDENFIRIKSTPSDLLLKVVTMDSLVGEGFATGSYTKIKNNIKDYE